MNWKMHLNLYRVVKIMSFVQSVVLFVITKIHLQLLQNVFVAIAALEPGRLIAGFKEIVPSKMILTNSEILNSGCSVTPKNEFRSNEDNKTESTIVSDNSIDSNSSCEIIFNDSTESNNEERIPESEIYDGDDYDDYEDYDSDDDNDENKDDSEEFSSESESDGDTSPNEDNCISKTKKVTFNLKPVVHTMIKWDYAYRAARKGPWEQMARDRSRFNGRISSYHLILDPILQDDHRVRIWTERFS
ncbi:PREDICTED: phosphopantothenoylcysteine decarboxylase subunit VHS3 isoform X2 [Polistes canadensis]|uniref:phosphopantothenoylcysteine decarboxylase subunit VHS3 isoform X2 n=1 Tax=Polistes canadensis TaxID=91411 RepID=UPI000718D751|nr:PREDICTED: phosphopantothenoylcysteine decarboxylase subunit VHS3 isoform X2 [Polistes canadensis]